MKTRYSPMDLVDTPPRLPDTRAAAPRHRGARIARYVIVCLIAMVGLDALVGDRGLMDRLKANRESLTLEAALSHARQQNTQLRERARRLREDPAAIEEVARREFGFLKPGEQLFIVKDVAQADVSGRK